MPKINLRESISEISKTWNYDVTDRTIRHSFAKAGFFVSNENSASTEDEDDIPLEELKKMWIQLRKKEEINDDVLIDDFLSLDSEAEASETLTELDILDSVKNKNNTAMNCDEGEDDVDGNDRDPEINKPSYDEMLKSFETIRRGLLQFEENTPEVVFGALQRCETYYERKHFFKQKTHTKLTDFIRFRPHRDLGQLGFTPCRSCDYKRPRRSDLPKRVYGRPKAVILIVGITTQTQKSQLRERRGAASRLDSTKDSPCIRRRCTPWAERLPAGVS
ncbi:hypothetical protein AVEN_26891-1 [Araneus ventricosus]|uniref:DDE-1 domain-containing protein n=1 Tax=Araneus ventricosus TaxID=182803 RepID=A0A4Y2KI14_ARAVE|nr:hypothetical protein AVEN_26891-1 [Araneus ventricosus]